MPARKIERRWEIKEIETTKEIPENNESQSKYTWVKSSPVEPSVRPYFARKKDNDE
jgi:hypothetical protein